MAHARRDKSALIGMALFGLGIVPLLGLALFSPGLGAEGLLGALVVGYSLGTLVALGWLAVRRRWMWVLVLAQIGLLALVCYETLSGGALYTGT